MGSRKCGSCLSSLLIPLALWSIIVNILLYFPNGQASYASSNKLTNYVWYFEGICFSGIMMLVVAAVLLVLENDNNYKCCQSENCSKKYMNTGFLYSTWSWSISSQLLQQGAAAVPYLGRGVSPQGRPSCFECGSAPLGPLVPKQPPPPGRGPPNILRFLHLPGSDFPYPLGKAAGDPVRKVPGHFLQGTSLAP
ncbi:transmembrane 4 L6 family member 18 isoform X2 [Moschus berezovskii]|uniref:transmembrane 4 L6 family member 18 isoform X2 n=1 Tax=Moschus berezovskii TaxID=68408 RepID=UPI0024442A16|nr:transmembrane 4 L6 family member 18 isoform X2 [Moschus berezovskii]